MSLQEQLLKAGLVSADRLKQMETEERKQRHQAKKSKAVAAAEAARKAEEAQQRQREIARKQEQDRRLNLEREAHKKQNENRARARQLLDSRRPKEADATIRYSFMEGRFIRYVWVSQQRQRQLATGHLGIVRNADNRYDYPILPREAALKLAALFPEELLLLHPQSDSLEADDEWPE